ncbi:ABC transporter permease [Pseudomonas fakonensis]|uniref:ABC transporter permease n=1 Tax=Pseudomonas fakonensis TaxID=2842355 RepID=A0ABX8N9I1_9PSED|nr:ABC transporter permease [Pseudomonas fakonensis]QXH52421.1 ABC transporter permease [Pseudomonas fakonensis]
MCGPPEHYGPGLQMRLGESVASLRQLGRRAWLAVLGIAVGCAAVVALLNVGHSAAMHAQQLFQGMGSELMVANLIPVEDSASRVAAVLDLQALPAALRGLAPMAMAVSDARSTSARQSVMVVGSTPALAGVLGLQVQQGRLLAARDADSTHVLLGAGLAQQLGAAAGGRLQLGRYLFEVVGVLAPQGYNPMVPVAVDDALLMPLPGLRRLSASAQPSVVLALAGDGAHVPEAARVLQVFLQGQLPAVTVEVLLAQQLLDGMARQARLFTGLLAGLGAIALLVGGVGVMNVMLMNVSERRREIGVRMALGARPVDIAWLFLLEAALLAVAGALLGALAGLLAAWAFTAASGWLLRLDPWSIPLGVTSALGCGVFFGLQPALSAARLEPVVALRDD